MIIDDDLEFFQKIDFNDISIDEIDLYSIADLRWHNIPGKSISDLIFDGYENRLFGYIQKKQKLKKI